MDFFDANMAASVAALTAGGVEVLKRFVPSTVVGKEENRAVTLPLIAGILMKFMGVGALAVMPWGTLIPSILVGSIGSKVIHDGLSPVADPILDKVTAAVKTEETGKK